MASAAELTLDDLAEGTYDETLPPAEFPTFNKGSKKGEMVAFLKERNIAGELPDDELAELSKTKKDDLLPIMVARFGDPQALAAPGVTGFDPTDELHSVVADVESVATEAAACTALSKLSEGVEFDRFKIGGILSRMVSEGWCGEHEDFYTYAKAELGYSAAVVKRLILVYNAVTTCGATWEEAQPVGWMILATIATVLTPDNYREVFFTVEGMSWASAHEWVKQYKAELRGEAQEGNEPDPVADQITTLKLRFHDENHLEVVETTLTAIGDESGTEDRAHQVYRLCLEHQSGERPPVPAEEPALDFSLTPPEVQAELTEYLADAMENGPAAAMEDAILLAADAALPGDLVHYPDGAPEVTESELLANVRDLLQAEEPEQALELVGERLELVGEEE